MTPLVVTGLTATGKSAHAQNFAEQFNGEIICCDRFCLYDFFCIATGRADMDKWQGPKHLYGHLHPLKDMYSPEEYLMLVLPLVKEIGQRGRLAIFEGSSSLLVKPLFDLGYHVTALRTTAEEIAERSRIRVAAAVKAGVREEVAEAVRLGYQNCYAFRESAIFPIAASLLDAPDDVFINRLTEQCVRASEEQREKLAFLPERCWVQA